jgi:hypothetical protein
VQAGAQRPSHPAQLSTNAYASAIIYIKLSLLPADIAIAWHLAVLPYSAGFNTYFLPRLDNYRQFFYLRETRTSGSVFRVTLAQVWKGGDNQFHCALPCVEAD